MIISFVFQIFGKVPPITRLLILVMLGIAISVNLQLWDETMFYYDYNRIFLKKEYWRLFTSILFQREFSLMSIIYWYIFYQYTADLEDGSFRTKSEDFFYIVWIIFATLIGISYITDKQYVSPLLLEIFIYMWSQSHHRQIIFVMGVIRLRAGYLPYFYLFFSFLIGGNILFESIGILVGHILYYFYFIVPKLPFTRGINLLAAPRFTKTIVGALQLDSDRELIIEEGDFVENDNFIPNAL